MVARQKVSPKSSFWKTHPPHPDDFLGRWGVWCCEGSGVSPSREDIGSLSDFPSFRDEAQLDRCSQKWSKFGKIFRWRKFRGQGKWKNPWFPQIRDFRKYRKVIIFISVRSRRKIRARVSWAFSRAVFSCPERAQRNQTCHRLKKSDGKWWIAYKYIHVIKKRFRMGFWSKSSDFRINEKKRFLSSSIKSSFRVETHTRHTWPRNKTKRG